MLTTEPSHFYAAVVSAVLAWRGYKKKSLSLNGAWTAFGVGTVISACGVSTCAALFAFYVSGSYLTKRGSAIKAKVEKHYSASGGNRSAWQVLCNGAAAACICCAAILLHRSSFPHKSWFLAVIGQFAAMQGDTWSSELGVLSTRPPRLIIGWRQVPRGTNGAVSVLGLGAALASGVFGGAVVAACNAAFPQQQSTARASTQEILVTSIVCALGGSLVDSCLGQFLQKSIRTSTGHIVDGYDAADHDDEEATKVVGMNVLSNNGVNFVTSCLVTVATMWWWRR